uniref:amino acid adenylation domain-containing protein n=1 Tax=Ascidiimonas meishanensis TaxID=3128903 RepID=UPI0030EBB6A6
MENTSLLDTNLVKEKNQVWAEKYWEYRLKNVSIDQYFDLSAQCSSVSEIDEGLLDFELSKKSQNDLHRLAPSLQAKEMVLLGALSVLAYSYSGIDDITIFKSQKTNNNDASNNIVLPIRISRLEEMSFKEVLNQLKTNLIKDKVNAHSSALGLWLKTKTSGIEKQLVGWIFEEKSSSVSWGAQMPALVFCFNRDEISEFKIKYDTHRFDQSYIKEIGINFSHVLDKLIQSRESLSENLSEVRKELFRLIDGQSENLPIDLKTNLLNIYQKRLHRSSEVNFINNQINEVSIAEVDKRVNSIVSWLQNQHIGASKPVLLIMQRDEWFLSSILATWKAGNVYLHIDPTISNTELLKIKEVADASVILVSDTEIEQKIASTDRLKGLILNCSKLEINNNKSFDIPFIDPADISHFVCAKNKNEYQLESISHGQLFNHFCAQIVPYISVKVQNNYEYAQQQIWKVFTEIVAGNEKISACESTPELFLKYDSGILNSGDCNMLYNFSNITLRRNILEKSETTSIPKAPEKKYYKLSLAQRRMYFLHAFNPASVVYNITKIFRLSEAIEISRLEIIFNLLVQRHESLRTNFKVVDEIPVQEIQDSTNFEMVYRSASESNAPKIVNEFVKPFDLANELPFRAGLISIKEGGYILMLDTHHIVNDGLSYEILTKDFLALYQNMDLSPLEIQYKDFAEWQQSKVQQQRISAHKNYWLDKFSDEVSVLELPTDYDRPILKSDNGNSIDFTITSQLREQLYTLCNDQGVTMYTLLLAAFNIMLAKLGNQEDIIVGTPISGRHYTEGYHADLESIVGMFVSTLPLRNEVRGSLQLSEFLNVVSRNVTEAFEHELFPYDNLVEALGVERDSGRNPLFDTMFSYFKEGIPASTNTLTSAIQPYEEQEKGQSIFDLTLNVKETEANVYFSMQYCTDLFLEDSIRNFIEYFKRVLANIAKNLSTRIADIDILSSQEKYQLLHEFSNNYPENGYQGTTTVLDTLLKNAQKYASETAIVYNDKKITYKELEEQSNQFASFLKKMGVAKGDFIPICLERSIDLIVSVLGVLKVGGIYVPIDANYPKDRVDFMLNDSNAKIVLTQRSLETLVNSTNQKVVFVDEENYNSYTIIRPSSKIDVSDLAYVIYTSGTTGQPKGVLIKHFSLASRVNFYLNYYSLTNNDSILFYRSFSFDGVIEEYIVPFMAGSTCVIAPANFKSDLYNNILNYIEKHQITKVNMPPVLLQSISENIEPANVKKLASLRHIVSGGDKLTLSMFHAFRKSIGTKVSAVLYNSYGPTENTIDSTIFKFEKEKEYDSISIGGPVGNSEIYILTEEGGLVPVGVIGEICVAGDGISSGYLNREELTAEKFVSHPFKEHQKIYRTGDLGKWLPDGTIEFKGRKDSQVKIRGYRIELGEIEKQLASFNLISEAVVMAKNAGNNKFLVAYYVAKEEISAEKIKTFLTGKLPDFMVPLFYVHMQAFPLTSNGKINRNALPHPNTVNSEAIVKPTNDIEQALVEIWTEVLNLENGAVGTSNSFFDLGGHSLNAISLVNKINKYFSVSLSLREVFSLQTIQALACHIDQSTVQVHQAIIPSGEKPFYALSSAQKRMYFLYEFDRLSTAYNMPGVFKIGKRLEVAKLTQAFQSLVRRHESLRTQFILEEGTVVQRIVSAEVFMVATYTSNEASADEVIDGFMRPFDLANDYPFRAGLIHLEEGGYILLFDMHHIISDGVSHEILLNDFWRLYRGDSLPELPLQYRDYAEWQQSDAQASLVASHKEYWLDVFSEEVNVLELPTDHSRPLVRTDEGGNAAFSLDKELVQQLQAIAKNEEVTTNILLLSAYYLLLGKLGNTEDVVIGSPVSGRLHFDLEGIVGMFINTLPLRNKPKSSLSFREFLHEVKANTLAAFDHQLYQYEDLVEALQLERNTGRNPLFDVTFTYNIEGTSNQMEFSDLEIESHEDGSNEVSKFDMSLIVTENDNELYFSINYNRTLFEKSTIERFISCFKTVLKSIASTTNFSIGKLKLVSPKEEKLQLINFNENSIQIPKDKSIVDIFKKRVEEHPDNIALLFEGQELTYEELERRSNQLANYLANREVAQGDFVVVCMERSIDMIVGILGILKVGAAYVPIDPNYPQERIDFILKDTKSRIVLSDFFLMDRFQMHSELEFLSLEILEAEIETQPVDFEPISIKGDSLAYVIYTSGSTGLPKGTLVPHSGVVRLSFLDCLILDENTKMLQVSSVSFDAATFEIWGALLNGGQLVLFPFSKVDITDLNNSIREENINTIWLTAALFDQWVRSDLAKMPLKYLLVGGDIVKPASVRKVYEEIQEIEVINGYGPTENTTFTCCYTIPKNHSVLEPIPIGKPIPGTKVYVLDDNLELCPIGVSGMLYTSGLGLAKGYLNNKELTEKSFVNSPFEKNEILYKTGDLVRWTQEGTIQFIGRKDTQVKLRGFRIELGEIEKQLQSLDSIEETYVIAKETNNDKYLIAYYVGASSISPDILRSYLSSKLPAY